MKKLLKWVFPAILGIVPALGMDEFEIKDPFFTQPGVARSIFRVIENGNDVLAQVTATDQTMRNENRLVKALCATTGWIYDDAGLFAQEKINAQVICANDFLTKPYVRTLHTPYTPLEKAEARYVKGIALKAGEALPVGELVEVREISKYRRPGEDVKAVPFESQGPILYQLLLEETTAPIGSGWIATCLGCAPKDGYKGVFHSGGKHNLQAYSGAKNVTHTLWQISLVGEKIKKEETTKKHATKSVLYENRRDHSIKADLQSADFHDNLNGWIIH